MSEGPRGIEDVMVGQQRNGFFFAVFVLWVLSLPFYQYSLVATYSIDNLLAPFLLLGAMFLPHLQDRGVASRRLQVLLGMFGLFFMYGVSCLIASIGDWEHMWHVSWIVIRSMIYFMVPALFIRDLRSFRMMKSLLIVITLIGAMSAFMAAMGLIHFEVERYAESRLGLSWLPKSIGLFGNYGDMAMLYVFTCVVLISHKRNELMFGMGTRLGKWLIWIGLLLGLAGMQSRNIFFATIIGMGVYWVHRKLQTSKSNVRIALVVLILAGTIVLTGMALTFGHVFVEEVSSMGGKAAQVTVEDRLMSYGQAWKLYVNEPFFGISAETYRVWGKLTEFVHNMWLNLLLKGGPLALASVAGIIWMAYKAGSGQWGRHPASSGLVVSTAVSIFISSQFYPGLTEVMWLLLGTLISFSWVRYQQVGGNQRKLVSEGGDGSKV